MKILKFGGTSVGTAESIKNVKSIITSDNNDKMLVLSAMSGVTNMLVELGLFFKEGRGADVEEQLLKLRAKHYGLIDELITDDSLNQQCKDYVQAQLSELHELYERELSEEIEARIVTTGESLLTFIFSNYLTSESIQNTLLDAKEFMRIDNLENPDTNLVGKHLEKTLQKNQRSNIYITQGFVRINKDNEICTLKRGGSDYSATIIGAALKASEVQIWTDISGLHNNDPRFVQNTHPVANLSFEEAAELAYFGAKILHPQTISPVIGKGIPVFLKNTFTPEAVGTRITAFTEDKGLKAISAKDEITAIRIKSNRMLMAHGFLRKIFEVFDKYETAIDMITTSEIAISLTIDDSSRLDKILDELEQYGEISVDPDHSIICVVGEGLIEESNTSRLFEILKDVPVRMISYGGSKNNISLLVDTQHKIKALKQLNDKLFVSNLQPS
ncbi:aspartate kinase [Christiangramia fulva]|uniref:Aspartokinase n=1 Tax=Christiangramia fulva TaxID=2126553 RepID=A0A2R3Z7Y0_9FLAO|nr:aspartate kinase [Christiangramia fulva]AVR46328.1 aspartate kinase [Christiangramia fulva]